MRVKTIFNRYRSDLEGSVADQLEKQRVEFVFEPSRIKYEVQKKYTPDFLLPNGILIEVKGAQHPELDIRFVFGRLRSKVQGGRFTCQSWCEKYDFKFAESFVPNDWIHE